MSRKIKRYNNRKLYDTEEAKYTSLSKLYELIRSGFDIEVSSHETGEDLTSDTLGQILATNSKHIPTNALFNTIRFENDTVASQTEQAQ